MITFLDLDGTIVKWAQGLCKLIGADPQDPEVRAILLEDKPIEGGPFGTRENVAKVVEKAGYSFWMELELEPWAFELYNFCIAESDEVYFLTSPSTFSEAAHAKIDFVKKVFDTDKIIITKHKHQVAGPSKLLIDDQKRNIVAWGNAGGVGYFWPNSLKLEDEGSCINEQLFELRMALR